MIETDRQTRGSLRSLSDLARIRNEIEISSSTGRKHTEYFDFFGYTPDNLEGKLILDVGAGNANFAERAGGFGACVLRLDARSLVNPRADKKDVFRGAAQFLPFRDDTFDETISSFCLWWIDTGVDRVFAEMIRVTKPGGKIKIYPVILSSREVSYGTATSLVCPSGALLTLVIDKEPSRSKDYWGHKIEEILSCVKFFK